MTAYDSLKFQNAAHRFAFERSQMSLEEIALIDLVAGKEKADDARAAVGGHVETETNEEKRDLDRPMSLRFFLKTSDYLSLILASYRFRINQLEKRLEAVEDRAIELESKPSVRYLGVFEEQREYREGDAVTWGGHLWIARSSSTGVRPGFAGENSKEWTLAVKRGRDGKDRTS